MTKNIQSWSVCVLCYNEEGAISTVLEKLKRILNTFSQEDNSASGTVAAEATEEDPKEASLEIKDVKVEYIIDETRAGELKTDSIEISNQKRV